LLDYKNWYSFIVNQDYFGDEDAKDKIIDTSIDRITQINKVHWASDYSGILTSKPNDIDGVNDTVDDLVMNLENPKGRIYRVGKPTKVEDINSVMNEQNYAVLK